MFFDSTTNYQEVVVEYLQGTPESWVREREVTATRKVVSRGETEEETYAYLEYLAEEVVCYARDFAQFYESVTKAALERLNQRCWSGAQIIKPKDVDLAAMWFCSNLEGGYFDKRNDSTDYYLASDGVIYCKVVDAGRRYWCHFTPSDIETEASRAIYGSDTPDITSAWLGGEFFEPAARVANRCHDIHFFDLRS